MSGRRRSSVYNRINLISESLTKPETDINRDESYFGEDAKYRCECNICSNEDVNTQ